MEELLSMGFSSELAADALDATGGISALQAAEWILSRHPAVESPSPASSEPLPREASSVSFPKQQARVDRFFSAPSRPNSSQPRPAEDRRGADEDDKGHSPSFPSKLPSKRKYADGSNDLNSMVATATDSTVPGTAKPPAFPQRTNSKGPLAERMRPSSIDDIVGQNHLLGPGCILRSLIETDRMVSVIFWGPPGTGKTTLARAISRAVSYRFVTASAVTSGVKEVREILEEAKRLKKTGQRTLFFMDEVHRFNKAQQDAFLPYIEAGHVVFIGATTENPSFELNAALLSRCKVFTLNKLQPESIQQVLERALSCAERGVILPFRDDPFVQTIKADTKSLHFLAEAADGDARAAFNALEIAVASAVSKVRQQSHFVQGDSNQVHPTGDAHKKQFEEIPLDLKESSNRVDVPKGVVLLRVEDIAEALQRSHLLYDKKGEEHYNIISALHKSMRGGDPDAALYWLARMMEGGEGPLYIARRLVRFASEDVGLADCQAVMLAVACYQACHFLGMPECNVHLAQCVAYLALAPKSVAVYQAIEAAQEHVKKNVNDPVPLHLRNAPTRLMKQLGYGKGYIYPPGYEGPIQQEYMPPSLQGHKFLKWP